MKTRYRILMSRKNKRRKWEIIGAVYEREGWEQPVPLGSPVEADVNRRTWREIDRQTIQRKVKLENFEDAFGPYAKDYKLLPEIHVIEGESYRQIRNRLYDWYVLGKKPEWVEIEPGLEKVAV